ncbi:hypothetical protein [Aeromonas phage AS-yj]|uniref:Uncharacterized protein n=1 Tax=Aeromonas phage AS-yj TaxID=2026115 RepID=A0A291LF06_9CAUD|nr:hypothetical protein [Aeromonas phage AS-yj]
MNDSFMRPALVEQEPRSYENLTDVQKVFFKSVVEEVLQSGVVDLVFEKVDGTIRSGQATLDTEVIVEAIGQPTEGSSESKPRKVNPDVVRFFDVDKGAFRTFKLSNLIQVGFTTVGDIHHMVDAMSLGVVDIDV